VAAALALLLGVHQHERQHGLPRERAAGVARRGLEDHVKLGVARKGLADGGHEARAV
jgi:hypothetical protein